MKNTDNTSLKKEIDDLFKKLRIKNSQEDESKKVLSDYKLHTKFPSKFSQGKITLSSSTK